MSDGTLKEYLENHLQEAHIGLVSCPCYLEAFEDGYLQSRDELTALKSELASVRGELERWRKLTPEKIRATLDELAQMKKDYQPTERGFAYLAERDALTAEVARLKGEQSEVSAQTTRLCTEISMLRDRADKYLSDWEKDADQLRASLLESQGYQDELNKREILMKDSLKEAYAALEFIGTRISGMNMTMMPIHVREPDGSISHHRPASPASEAYEKLREARDKLLKRHEWLKEQQPGQPSEEG